MIHVVEDQFSIGTGPRLHLLIQPIYLLGGIALYPLSLDRQPVSSFSESFELFEPYLTN